MTGRRIAIAITVAVAALAFALAYGARASTTGGVPIPTAPASSGSGLAFAPPSGQPALSPSTRASGQGLPRPDLTPGAIDPTATQDNLSSTICKPGWAKTERPPSAYTGALKLVQIIEYGYGDRNPGHYQEDHLVPLELGGAPRDHRNLWPEPNATTLSDGTPIGSKQKDALENRLHAEVCAGSLSLADAQRNIATDWIAAWEAAGRP